MSLMELGGSMTYSPIEFNTDLGVAVSDFQLLARYSGKAALVPLSGMFLGLAIIQPSFRQLASCLRFHGWGHFFAIGGYS